MPNGASAYLSYLELQNGLTFTLPVTIKNVYISFKKVSLAFSGKYFCR